MNSGDEGTIPLPLSEGPLRTLVLDAIGDATDNLESFHARFGHLDRGLQYDDVIHGLEQEWQFDRPPVFNKRHWQWNYYIDTENVDGGRILIIIAVDIPARTFEVVTRWPK